MERVPKKVAFLRPAFPLLEKEVEDPDKSKIVSYSLKVHPQGPNNQLFKKHVRTFGTGTPSQWIDTIRAIQSSWRRNNMAGLHDCVGVVSSILTDEALAYFEAAIEEQTHKETEDRETEEVPLTNEMVDKSLRATSGAILPHWALEAQKL